MTATALPSQHLPGILVVDDSVANLEFLGMISHGLRTPANGLPGIGALLIDLCPPSAERTLYKEVFLDSSARLRDLIEDATLIMELDTIVPKPACDVPLLHILAGIGDAHPDIRIHTEDLAAREQATLRGEASLLKRALEAPVLLAASFSTDPGSLRMTGEARAQTLRIHARLLVQHLPDLFQEQRGPDRLGHEIDDLPVGMACFRIVVIAA